MISPYLTLQRITGFSYLSATPFLFSVCALASTFRSHKIAQRTSGDLLGQDPVPGVCPVGLNSRLQKGLLGCVLASALCFPGELS